MTGPGFETDRLTKWFRPGAPVLEALTLTASGPGAIGYLGPNGAGKSTTMKLLVGLLRPSSGTVRINGFDPVANRPEALWDVGAVIEEPEPYRSETVFDALNRVGVLRGMSPESIDHDIDRCHEELSLPPLGMRCGWLSKGQRQRVVFAAARMGDPRILLLDEPTLGMDPASHVQVRSLIRRLRTDHLILMSSHQLADVMEVCDRLVFLDAGRMLLEGRTDDVAASVHSKLVEVAFARPVEPEELRPLGAIAEATARVSERRYRITFDGREEVRTELMREALRIAPITSFTSATSPLEDAYLKLVGARPGA